MFTFLSNRYLGQDAARHVSILKSLSGEQYIRPGTDYETETPFIKIRIPKETEPADARKLFAVLTEEKLANLLAGMGKITLVVGENRPVMLGDGVFDVADMTFYLYREDNRRLRVMTFPDPEARLLKEIETTRKILLGLRGVRA